MRCAVIYFSLTGNTEKVARAIQKGVMKAAGNCDIFPIKNIRPTELSEYDLVGLGTPVLGWLPRNVQVFVKKLDGVAGKHAFSFCTHNTFWDEYFPSVIPELKAKGLVVIGWDHWFGSAYGPLSQPTPYLTDGHPDEIDLQEAEVFGEEMVSRSARIRAGETGLIPDEPKMPSDEGRLGLPPPPSKKQLAEMYRNAHKSVLYERGKCTFPDCTLCVDNCPMDGIDLSAIPPRIAKPCMLCQLCDQVCPTGAIRFDARTIEAQERTDAEVDFMSGAVQRCRELEQKGLFRRLVPEDEIGWDKPIYRVYDQHPRFVLGKGRPYGVDPLQWQRTDHDRTGESK